MRAAQYDRYGAPDVLSERDAAAPSARHGHAIVRIEATSVNAVDTAVRAGKLWVATGWSFPKGTGLDVLGTVDSVGDGWQGPGIGARVWGFKPNLPNGSTLAAAELYEVGAGWISTAPEGGPELGSLPLVGTTAYRGLDRLGVRPGSSLLVRGAAGGVGAAAVQLAAARGATVTALVSAADRDFVRSIGAREALDYRTVSPDTIDARFDGVLDLVGSDVLRWRRVTTPSGRYATTANSATPAILLTSLMGPKRVRPIVASPRRDELDAVAAAVTSGVLRPQVGASFPLEQIAQAHAALAGTRGKVLVTIQPE